VTPSEYEGLPEGTLEGLVGRVGASLRGSHDGSGLRIGLACGLFNGAVSARLLEGALAGATETGVDHDDITVAWAPGAFELPMVARAFATAGRVDAVACLGAVIRGETGHYDFVAGQCAAGVSRVQLDTGVPVIFGVLTTDTMAQALARSEPGDANKGREAVLVAVEMVRLLAASPFRS